MPGPPRPPRTGFFGLKVNWPQAPELAWRALVLLVALGLFIAVVTRWGGWEGRAGWQTTDDAYLQSDLTPIAAKVPGYLRELPVQDFERVKSGQELAQIVDDDYRAAVDQAAAGLAAATAQVATLKAQYALQKANVAAAAAASEVITAALDQNTRDLTRQHRLLETGSSSTEATEKLQTTREQLAAQLDQNRAQVLAAQRQLDVLSAQASQAQAAEAGQAASLETARINLGYTHIIAPEDGVVGQRQAQRGQYIGVGGQIITLTPLPKVWVIANFKETQLTHMAVGDQAEVRVDTFPGRTLKGHVQSFAPGSGAVFALLPPDNATGNFTKVVQRIAVKIVIDDAGGLADRLRPGMSVEARVNARGGGR